jgi:hypothetical protein
VQELLGPLDATADHVLVRRNADCLPEYVREVVRTDTECLGYVRQREVFVTEMTIDEGQGLLHPAHRQSSLRTGGLRTAPERLPAEKSLSSSARTEIVRKS